MKDFLPRLIKICELLSQFPELFVISYLKSPLFVYNFEHIDIFSKKKLTFTELIVSLKLTPALTLPDTKL